MDNLLLTGVIVLVVAVGLIYFMGKKKGGSPQSKPPQQPRQPQNPPQ